MTDYERLKAGCLERGELWEDPDFPATQSSVFYHQTPPFNFVWKRAKEIYTDPAFVRDNCDAFDVVPGKLGDKWLVSCLSVLFLSKGLLYRVVPADQRLDAEYAGIFRFRIWWCGQWLEVLVDDRLPTVNGKLAFLQTSSSEQLWPALLEKAYAKLHGSYEALKYGTLLDGMADLTGGITESILMKDLTCGQMLRVLLRMSSIVTAHYLPNGTTSADPKGLENEINYRVHGIEEGMSNGERYEMIRLRRPLVPSDSMTERNDPFLNTVRIFSNNLKISKSQAERDRANSATVEFSVTFEDFQRLFHRVELVHLDAETSWPEPSLQDKQKWQVKLHQGAWRRGVTAGGCRNYAPKAKVPSDFFHMNPQVQLIVTETDRVVVSLNQHSVMEPKVIGFSIYKLPRPLNETASPEQFKKLKSTINSQYSNSRQVSHRCDLQPGAYLIMPTTFEPREEACFSLRVFSSKTTRMKTLDSPPLMTKAALLRAPAGLDTSSFLQYEAVFLQLADEHRTIDAFELQELLEACLPNDYIKSCSSVETCRQIVLSLDTEMWVQDHGECGSLWWTLNQCIVTTYCFLLRSGTGRITLSNFKDLMCSLKHWQMVFKTHAREKMGVLIAERLRDALKEIGFIIPDRAMTLLLLRYMRKDGMLRFGDFVSTVMHLHRAFNVYFTQSSLNTPQSTYINLNLAEASFSRAIATYSLMYHNIFRNEHEASINFPQYIGILAILALVLFSIDYE